tara:strand:- start:637 stop:1566 length:930 start_codon:yes stop_codon:yes gene_type:complete
MDDLPGGLCGLVNFGATCYLNSILQSFINNDHMLEYILNDKYSINNNFEDNILTLEINKLLKGSWNDNCTIVPKSLVITLSNIDKNNLNEQNDPDEYYEKIIDRLYEETKFKIDIDTDNLDNIYEKEWLLYFKKNISFVNNIFYGQYKSEILCNECNHSTLSYSPFISLKLELSSSNMLNCLKNHLSWEEDVHFTCEKCSCKNNVKKRLTLIRVPDIFVITLKRYNNVFDKNNQNIDISNSFNIDNNKLELFCIINHYGSCIYSGHYTAYVKHIKDNQWYHMNDNNISKIDINTIDTSDIYMLFYKKIK